MTMTETRPPTASIFTADPTMVLETSRRIARTLGSVLEERELVMSIGRSKHVLIEGWTLLGSMVGVFAEVEWSRPVFDADGGVMGWEARAVAKTLEGRVISAAESMCGHDEGRWRRAEEYAVRSMAQTRAVSKALRLPLGFIVELAGYSATPAEEIPVPYGGDESAPPAKRPTPAAEARGLRQAIEALRLARDMSHEELAELAVEHGVERGGKATLAQLRAIHDRLLMATVDEDAGLPDIPKTESDTDDHDDRTEGEAGDGTAED